MAGRPAGAQRAPWAVGRRCFGGGALSCTPGCQYDTSGCFQCGDGVVEGIEVCDGANLDGETCLSQGYVSGTLACSVTCTFFNTSGCSNLPKVCNASSDRPNPEEPLLPAGLCELRARLGDPRDLLVGDR